MSALQGEHQRTENDDDSHEEVHDRNRPLITFQPPVAEQSLLIDFLPASLAYSTSVSLRSVAVLLPDLPSPFEFGVLAEVFGIDRTGDGVPAFDFRVCTEHPERPVAMDNGLAVSVPYGLEGLNGADVVAVSSTRARHFGDPVLQALRDAHAQGSTILSVCSGVFVLAEAGLLDGRRATCHWYHAAEFARAHPTTTVDADVLFVDDGEIITSAGTAAGIDACLHLVRRELGADIATRIARRMVVPPQRDGGQRQFVNQPVPEVTAESLAPLLAWMVEHLDEDLSVPLLARRALLSERTFARRFVAETGTTPAKWLARQRLHYAQRLLEQTDLTVEQVAHRSGFGSAPLLRDHFARVIGVPPADYRRTFRTCEPAAARGIPSTSPQPTEAS